VCQRRYTPGSEWAYAKCYCGHANADRVLGELAAPLARTLVDSGVADAWFFARYGDPDWHVRVRIHGGDAAALWREAVPLVDRLAAPLLERRILWKLQFDTYEREVERYGGPDAIALSEALFFADSDAAIDAIAAGADVDARWRLALVGMDRLLDDFSLDVEQKLHLVEGMRDAMRREHAGGPRTARALGAKYREERSSLAHLFDGTADADGANEMVGTFDERSRRIRRVAAGLRQLVAEGRSSQTIPELCGSYLHMHANRLLRRDARRQELVLYDLLARLYESRIACALTR
jgi:thiopeptide-type bacteriocin biosynthesis protein